MPHPAIIVQGTQAYVSRLRAVVATGGPALAQVAQVIIDSLETSQRLGPALTPADLPFTAQLLAALSTQEKRALGNPFLPGYGDPSAKALLVGTEGAFDFDNPRPRGPSPDSCFAMADCMLQGLWASDGAPAAPQLAAQTAGRPPHCPGGYAGQRHPYEFLYPVPPGHLWRRICRVLVAAGLNVQACASPVWGSHAYLFELSDTPARQQGAGALPTAERRRFLPDLLAALPSARVLAFYGRWNHVQWDQIRIQLGALFLGLPPANVTRHLRTVNGEYRWMANGRASERSSRMLVLMQSPNRRGPTNAFLDAVGHLIGPYCI